MHGFSYEDFEFTKEISLDIPNVEIKDVLVNEAGDYIITVESTRDNAICQHCGNQITKPNGHGREIELRHLPILGHHVYIRLRPKWYECPDCGRKTTTQKLDWYEPKRPHTKAYDQHLMLHLINSTVTDVSRKEDVSYGAVAGTIKRCVHISVNWGEFTELKIIGLDEIAMNKKVWQNVIKKFWTELEKYLKLSKEVDFLRCLALFV